MLSEQTIDKIKGVIYGQAIGDALGLGTESMTSKEVRNHYPSGLKYYTEIIDDSYRKRWKKGEWTDDTDQVICILNSILKNGELNENKVAHELYDWMKRGPKDIGYFTAKVLEDPEFLSDPHAAAKRRWLKEGMLTAPNGALMRTSIIGTWMFWDKDAVTRNAENVAKTTHYDPRCVASSVIVSQIIRSYIDENRALTQSEISEIGKQYHEKVEKYVQKGFNSSLQSMELDDLNKRAYTLRGLSVALWAHSSKYTFEQALQRIIAEGGDSDTNAALACSILGARYGFKAIPSYLVDNLYNKEKLDFLIDSYISKVNSAYKA